MKNEEIAKNAETIESLKECFQDESIGVIGNNNNCGADYYCCPCCGNSQEIKGEATFMAHISTIEHEPDCRLNNIYKKLMDE